MTEYVCLRSHALDDVGIHAYCDLFLKVFHQKKSIDTFKRQFLPGPLDSGYHAIMRVDGVWKGCYSAIPLSFHQNQTPISCALVVDALIHPDYQGKGHLRKILEALYATMYLDGFGFLYGMPNRRFKPLLTGPLGWKDMGTMQWHTPLGKTIKNHIPPATIFRKPSPIFNSYRYFAHKPIPLNAGTAWVHPGFPNILTGLESDTPEQLPECFQELSRACIRPVLFPYLGPGSPGGITIPNWIRGNRTMIAAYPLTMQVPDPDQILFRLSEFDVY